MGPVEANMVTVGTNVWPFGPGDDTYGVSSHQYWACSDRIWTCRDQYWTFEDQHGTCMDHSGPEGINLGINITTMEAVGTNMGPVDDQHRVK